MKLFSINKVPEKNQKNNKSAHLKIKKKEKAIISMENQHKKKLMTIKERSRKQR